MPLPPPPLIPTPGLNMSGHDFIKSALRMIRVYSAGDVPTAADAADSLAYLNQMMDAWDADALSVPNNQIQDFPLIAGQGVYMLGPGGDFNTLRPGKITAASVVLLNNPAQPNEQEIQILTEDEFQDIQLKLTPGTFPLVMYDDGASPKRNVTFWPVPSVINTFRMYSWQANTKFPDLATVFNFAPGYAEAIRYNLALRLADEFGGQLGQTIVSGAQMSLATVRTGNIEIQKLECDDMFQGVASTTSTSKFRSSMFGIP